MANHWTPQAFRSLSGSMLSPPGCNRPRARLRCSPEDFVVDELPAYAPSGSGEHLFVTFRKTGSTTLDAVRAIAEALGVDPREAGFAGMKDKHAITTQTASFFVGRRTDAEAQLGRSALPGIEVLAAARHTHKLKPGHLAGNRFAIVLRGVTDVDAVIRGLETAARVGVPNAFGPQRFGRDGDNPERALAWLGGRARGPRDRREQRLLFSSLQSLLYNRVLERRVAGGTWAGVLQGDLVKKHDTGGLFGVPTVDGPDLDEARARAAAGLLSATGPMFGAKMRWPEGAARAIEEQVLTDALGKQADLGPCRHLGEGTRRALRVLVAELHAAPEPGTAGTLRISFVLSKGSYATTVLAQTCDLVDVSRPGAAREEDAPPAQECA